MIKVLLMMTYARAAEADPRLLEKRLAYSEDIAAPGGGASYYGTSSLVVGSSYRIGDLIDTMIVDSDNGAKDLLLSYLPIADFSRTLGDFGLTLPKQGSESLKMSPKVMSIFFRTLYSATYLNPTNSEVALDLLARTKWKEGLVDGVPYGTVVAHKFGEFVTPDEKGGVGELELHDCGIVYAPNEPYFICVMTRGYSHERLAKLISTISQHVYAGITDAKP
jgi:beta-lactamase class A